jgi:hypothetical protein
MVILVWWLVVAGGMSKKLQVDCYALIEIFGHLKCFKLMNNWL